MDLEEFCKIERVSYTKMCNCLSRSFYRNPGSEMENTSDLVKSESDNILPNMELKPLVIDAPVPDALEETRRQRCLRIAPLLHELKSELDRLQNTLDSGKEADLLGVINYALKEYPCILHCLEDGTIDLSNNACERQIRRIAKYRNNNFFVGSPDLGRRFARLQSVFTNICNHKLAPQQYLCDIFRRIKNAVKDELVYFFLNKWQPQAIVI